MGGAARLPEVEPDTSEANRFEGVPQETITKLGNQIQTKLGKLDIHWHVFDPSLEEEPVASSLGLDLAETYDDIQDGLALIERGSSKADVLWQLRFDFLTHWGEHALVALRYVHWLMLNRP